MRMTGYYHLLVVSGLLFLAWVSGKHSHNPANPIKKGGFCVDVTTNAQIAEALKKAAYRSIHTGRDIDEGITKALGIKDYIDTYVRKPFTEFTGDFERVTLGEFEQTVWLQSITINCARPFSKSVSDFHYWIELIDGTDGNRVSRLIDDIPHELMTEEGLSVDFEIRHWLPPLCRVEIVGESTKAFGQLDIKLNIT